MSSYIVAYMIGKSIDKSKDHYKVFCEGTIKQNKKDADLFVSSLQCKAKVLSINVTQIIATTEHYPVFNTEDRIKKLLNAIDKKIEAIKNSEDNNCSSEVGDELCAIQHKLYLFLNKL